MNKIKPGFILVFFLISFLWAKAHEIRPAYLEIREFGNRVEIFWKQPVSGESAIYLTPILSSGWLTDSVSENSSTGTVLIREWKIKTKFSVSGQTITIEGLKNTITDVLVNIRFADGTHLTNIIRPSDPTFLIRKFQQSALPVIDYLRLGIEHILFGVDHLLFVLALILIVKGTRRLIKTITAFTLAHSITLAAATLGWIHIPPAPVEAVIALSIIFLAVELIHYYRGGNVFSSRQPWVVSFIFGLLHGFGFAGALANVGLPPNEIPLTLFLFNAGVEIGQLIFILVAMSVIWILRRLFKTFPEWFRWVPPYAIGCMASFWFIERLAAVYFP